MFYIGHELEWDPVIESVILYNAGAGHPGSFQWSNEFMAAYKHKFGSECPAFLPLNQRIDNHKCITILSMMGFKAASGPDCIIAAMLMDKDLALNGLVIERHSDGSETVHFDENKYVVNKMLNMTAMQVCPSQCVHSLLMKCRELVHNKMKNKKAHQVAISVQ